jgi:hypothetical protein
VALAERDSQMAGTPPTSWESVRGVAGLPDWAAFLAAAAIFAVLVVGVAFVARKLGLRPRLSWLFALGVGMWMWAPVAADSAAGRLLAAAGLLMMPLALVSEFLLRRRNLDADAVR